MSSFCAAHAEARHRRDRTVRLGPALLGGGTGFGFCDLPIAASISRKRKQAKGDRAAYFSSKAIRTEGARRLWNSTIGTIELRQAASDVEERKEAGGEETRTNKKAA